MCGLDFCCCDSSTLFSPEGRVGGAKAAVRRASSRREPRQSCEEIPKIPPPLGVGQTPWLRGLLASLGGIPIGTRGHVRSCRAASPRLRPKSSRGLQRNPCQPKNITSAEKHKGQESTKQCSKAQSNVARKHSQSTSGLFPNKDSTLWSTGQLILHKYRPVAKGGETTAGITFAAAADRKA